MKGNIKKSIISVALIALLAISIPLQVYGASDEKVEDYMIYDSHQGAVVEKQMSVDLEDGTQWITINTTSSLDFDKLRLSESNIELEPINSENVEVTEIKLNTANGFEENIGEEITVVFSSDQNITGKLVRTEGMNIVMDTDEGISYINRENINRMITENGNSPDVKAKIKAQTEGDYEFKLKYRMEGVTWNPSYELMLNDGPQSESEFEGDIVIQNPSGKTFDGQVNLISGDVRSGRVILPEYGDSMGSGAEAFKSTAVGDLQTIGRVNLYNLGMYTIDSYSQKSINYMNDNVDTDVNHVYKSSAHSDHSRTVSKQLTFDNNMKDLPEGRISIYRNHNGSEVMVGSDFIERTAEGNDVEIDLGKSYDIEGSTKVLDAQMNQNNITREINITITNHADETREVTVEHQWINGEIIDTNIEPAETLVDKAIWKIEVDANSEKNINFKSIEQKFDSRVEGTETSSTAVVKGSESASGSVSVER
ncbi:hypothetical protein Metev_0360 [Methanohalobium evestigatum Z-7303]|uniref:DUF4139 domain-containing protein n=1 Tax=Methanohalobium evestigatum (strain ATCC BAA-1072 / DSM 3721 / NBRC 107634 / OCM 161 / Z-7303) TaxID=644295 RepID=D7E6R2_METEZ|nr:hypothetical protein [Methanohalobium evestigatum]ADI73284.1 hypothetical protein Metev_0360 [Methanohalobium evestigatum Z-7303]